MCVHAGHYVLLYLYVFNPNLTLAYPVVGNVHGSLEKRFPGVFHNLDGLFVSFDFGGHYLAVGKSCVDRLIFLYYSSWVQLQRWQVR
jgi:hypothetical protein